MKPFLTIPGNKFISFFFCLLLNFVAMSAAQAQMKQVFVSFAGDDISKISFYSSTEGYVAFYYSIGYTADSGRTFTKKYITSNNVNYNGYGVNLTFGFKINGVKAFSQDTLVVYGEYGRVPAILYSVNAGTSFKLIFHSQLTFIPNSGVSDMIFPGNGNTGYAVDADRILKTTDRGQSWFVIRTEVAKNYNALDAIDVNTIFAYTNGASEPAVISSSDGGASWGNIPLPTGNTSFLCADFVSLQKGWVNMRTNTEFKLYYTNNRGINWQQINDNEATPFSVKKISFINDSTGYAIGGLFQIYKTTSAGQVWEPLPRDNNYTSSYKSHNDFQLLNNNRLWAGGGDGFLELNVNPAGSPVVKAYYKVDRAGADITGIIKLVNYSNPVHQFKWYKNNVLISTAYHANYVYDSLRRRDTISLVVTDGFRMDSVIQYVDFPLPISITSFDPVSGNRGNTIVIRGNNLRSVTDVYFGGSPSTNIVLYSDTLISATVAEGASGYVTIRNVAKRDSLPGFKFTGPLIKSFSPDSAQLGVPVTIRGENLSGITSVYFGSTPVSSFSIIDSTKIIAITGPGTTGTVMVYGNNGTVSVPGFVYTGPSVISSFSPAVSGPLNDVTITGINLLGAYAVNFGDSAALSFSLLSASKIIATVKQGSSGNVSVATNANTATLSGYVYIPPPVITSFAPVSAQAGSSVIIRGKNFNVHADSNAVYFGPAKAIVTIASDTMLTVTVPTGAIASPIALACNTLATTSATSFLPAFPGATNPIPRTAFKGKMDFNTQYDAGAFFYDFNGDGKNDMIITDMLSRKFSVYQNTSAGNVVSFGAAHDFVTETGFWEPYVYPQAADLDGDGKPELVIEIRDRNSAFIYFYYYRNISSTNMIAFDTRKKFASYTFQTILPSTWYTLKDLDEDGRTDLLYSYRDGFPEAIHFYKNTSLDGVISFAGKKTVYQQENFFGGISTNLADMDGDGKDDLVFSEWGTSGRVRVALNKTLPGNISFASNVDFYSNDNHALGPVILDLDTDKKPDLFFYNRDSTKFTILKNTSVPGTVSFAPKVSKYISSGLNSYMLADVDGDTKPDIIETGYATAGASKMSIFKNTSTIGNISFADTVNFNVSGELSAGYATDLSGDGRPELSFTNTLPYGIVILTNKTTGSSAQLCSNGSSTIIAELTGSSYQWQENRGNGFVNISNSAAVTGTNTSTLHLNNIPPSWNSYQYRCVVDGNPGFFYTLQFVNSWKGTISNAWENAANWSCGTVPDSTTYVFIDSGTVILNSTTTVKSLKLSPGATLTVNPGFALTVIQ